MHRNIPGQGEDRLDPRKGVTDPDHMRFGKPYEAAIIIPTAIAKTETFRIHPKKRRDNNLRLNRVCLRRNGDTPYSPRHRDTGCPFVKFQRRIADNHNRKRNSRTALNSRRHPAPQVRLPPDRPIGGNHLPPKIGKFPIERGRNTHLTLFARLWRQLLACRVKPLAFCLSEPCDITPRFGVNHMTIHQQMRETGFG